MSFFLIAVNSGTAPHPYKPLLTLSLCIPTLFQGNEGGIFMCCFFNLCVQELFTTCNRVLFLGFSATPQTEGFVHNKRGFFISPCGASSSCSVGCVLSDVQQATCVEMTVTSYSLLQHLQKGASFPFSQSSGMVFSGGSQCFVSWLNGWHCENAEPLIPALIPSSPQATLTGTQHLSLCP